MTTNFQNLMQEVFNLPPGRERLVALEEVIRIADSEGQTEVAYEARSYLAELANAYGYPEKAIVAFSWCLTQFDKNPELDDPHSLIWQFKVILELIPIFSSVTRQQIESMQEDMARRLASVGETERTAHYYRSWNFMRMGDYDVAMKYQETYTRMSRSDSSDCLACERDRQVELLSRMQRDEEALKLAEPIIERRMSCGEVPEFTNAHIVRSYLRLGRIDDAVKTQKRGFQTVSSQNKYLGTIGDLMLPVIRIRDFDTGVRQLEKILPWCCDSAADELRMRFYSSCHLLMEALSASDNSARRFKIPKQLDCWNESETYTPSVLAKWFSGQTQTIVDRFNTRNGNQTYSEYVEESRRLCDLP